MGQNNTKVAKAKTIPSTLTRIKFRASYLSTIPPELLILITSFMDVKYQSALSRACKWLNTCYKEAETTIFCNSQKVHLYLPSIQELRRHLSRYGWNYFKLIPISGSVDYLKISKSRRNCLYLEKTETETETFEMPNELKLVNFDDLIISGLRNPIPSISFFENENLKKLSSLIIIGFEVMKGELEPVFSKFSLRFMSLTYCDMTKCDLSTMFVNLPTLQDFQLATCSYSDKSHLQFPANLEMLETGQYNESDIIDISLCIWLKTLILNAKIEKDYSLNINISELEHLRTFVPECKLTDIEFFDDSFANVEVLFLEWDRILKYETIGSSPIKDLKDGKNRHLDFSPLKKCSIKRLRILNIDPKYTISVATSLGTHVLTVEYTWPRLGIYLPQTQTFQLDPHKSIKRCLSFKIPHVDKM